MPKKKQKPVKTSSTEVKKPEMQGTYVSMHDIKVGGGEGESKNSLKNKAVSQSVQSLKNNRFGRRASSINDDRKPQFSKHDSSIMK